MRAPDPKLLETTFTPLGAERAGAEVMWNHHPRRRGTSWRTDLNGYLGTAWVFCTESRASSVQSSHCARSPTFCSMPTQSVSTLYRG